MQTTGGGACEAIAKVHAEVDSFGGDIIAAVDSYSHVVSRYAQTADMQQHMYAVCTAASISMKLYDVSDDDLMAFRFLLGMHALLAAERTGSPQRFGALRRVYELTVEGACAQCGAHKTRRAVC